VDSHTLDFATSDNHMVTAKFDGKEYKQDSNNTMVRLKRVNDHTIEISLNRPNGPAEALTWQVSGNTLVETCSGTGADGKPSKNVTYHERQH